MKRLEAARLQKLSDSHHWSKPKYDQMLNFNSADSLAFFQSTCSPFKTAFETFSRTARNVAKDHFYLDNGWYGSVDAELLYSFVRARQPKRIIEIGSGFSTRLMSQAVAEGQLQTRITSIDPAPRVPLRCNFVEEIRTNVEYLDPKVIVDALKQGDLLFVDSSHIAMTGGDVPYLFLEILPRLNAGVLIQIHDIFFPFEYPKEWVMAGWNWSEQYLVHAFLAYNPVFEIVWPARYMWEYYRAEITTLVSVPTNVSTPSSLWLRKTT